MPIADAGPLLEAVLVDGLLSRDPTVWSMAADALHKLNPENPALLALTRSDEDSGEAEPTHTSTTVHGTWARFRSDWWKPGSDFHSYLKRTCSTDLYSGTDC